MINFKKIEKSDLSFLNEVRNGYSEEFLHDSRKFTLDQTEQWFDKFNPEIGRAHV